MKLEELYGENLYSFQELDLDFTKYENGTTIILGKNLTMESSNGAGKSSILKILFLSFFGSDLNKVPLDSVVNDTNPKKGWITRIKFSDDKNTYTITRFRNYKNPDTKLKLGDGAEPKGSAIELKINEDVFYSPKDNSKIEKMVLGIIGMSPEIFLNSVLTGQKRHENFLTSPDSSKKELLSEILDLLQYDVAAKHLDKELKEKKELLLHKENKLTEFQTFMEKTHEDLKELKIQSQNHSSTIKEKEASLVKEIGELQEKLTEISNTKNEKQDLASKNKELEEITKKIQDNDNFLKELDSTRNKVNSFSLKEERLKNNIEAFSKSLTESNEKIEGINLKLSTKEKLSKDLKESTAKLTELDKDLKESKEIEDSITELQNKLNELNLELSKKDGLIKELQKKLEDLSQKLNKSKTDNQCFTCERPFEEANPLIDGLEKEITSANDEISNSSANKKTLEEQKESLLKSITELKDKFNIFKDKIKLREEILLANNNLENELNKLVELEKEISSLSSKKEETTLSINNANTELETLNKNFTKLKDFLTDLETLSSRNAQLVKEQSKIKEELFNLEKLNLEIANKEDNIKNIKNNLDKLTKDLTELQEGKNPYTQMIIRKTNELKKYETDFTTMNEEIKEINSKFKLLKFWEQGFSKNGIKSFIIDEIIILLNLKIKEYLNHLSGGNVSLLFESEKTVKSSKTTKNEISTKIYINGKLKHINSPSGGEEDRLNLAVDLALSDIAETRSGTKFNIKFLDEPFKWVDNKGQMKALALFNKLSLSRKGFFLITHDEKMQSFCNNAIYVINENGISRTVSKDEFMNLN